MQEAGDDFLSGPKTYINYYSEQLRQKILLDELIRSRNENVEKILKLKGKFIEQNKVLDELKENIFTEIKDFGYSHKNEKKPLCFNTIELHDRVLAESEENLEQQFMKRYSVAVERYVEACCVSGKEVADCFAYDSENPEEIIEALENETNYILNNVADKLAKQEVYSRSIEALTEMGYSVVGVKNSNNYSGEAISSTLLRVNDFIGINLTCINGERFTYEVVGVTEDGHSVTDGEAEKIADAMSGMCHTDFKEYIKKLTEKNFEITDLTDRPVDKRYCKNISEYTSNQVVRTENKDTQKAMTYHNGG